MYPIPHQTYCRGGYENCKVKNITTQQPVCERELKKMVSHHNKKGAAVLKHNLMDEFCDDCFDDDDCDDDDNGGEDEHDFLAPDASLPEESDEHHFVSFTTEYDPLPAPATIFTGVKVPVVVGPTWAINIRHLPPTILAAVQADLQYEPNAAKAAKARKKAPYRKRNLFTLAYTHAGVLHMPPWYASMAFPDAVITKTILTRGEPMHPDVEFTGTLRMHPPQIPAADTYFEWLGAHKHTPSAILCMPCGYGKTVLTLGIAGALKRVTLVLAHTGLLVGQWLTEIKRFMPNARVGCIKRDGNVQVRDKDIIVASLASIRIHIEANAEYLQYLLPRVGLVVLDEGHHAVAATFWKVLSSIPAAYRLVMTATPRRRDGLLKQLLWVAGPIVFRAFRKIGEVHVVHLNFKSKSPAPIMNRDGTLAYSEMLKLLTGNVKRTEVAVAIAAHLVKTQNRKVLILTPHTKHVEELGEMLNVAIAATGVPNRRPRLFIKEKFKAPRRKPIPKTCSESERKALIQAHAELVQEAREAWEACGPHGKWEEMEVPLVEIIREGDDENIREIKYESNVIVATGLLMSEGVSIPPLDTLILLENDKYPEQSVGRLLRDCPGKRVPLVVDLWVAWMGFAGAHRERTTSFYEPQRLTNHYTACTGVADAPPPEYWLPFNKEAVPV